MNYYDPLVEEIRARCRQLTARLNNTPKRIMEMLNDRAVRHSDKQVSEVQVVVSSSGKNRKKGTVAQPL